MKWLVRLKDGTTEAVEAESAYGNPVGALLFLKKATIQEPPADAPNPKKKPGWPKKAATVIVRGFAPGEWRDFILVDE